MYTLFFLKGVAPFIGSLCLQSFISRNGELCNTRNYSENVIQYGKTNPEDACYRDGIFYPRCKDSEILSHHNLPKYQDVKQRSNIIP